MGAKGSGQFRKPSIAGHKWCTVCHVEKLHAAFAANKNSTDGRSSQCRLCMATYRNTPEAVAATKARNAAYVLSPEQKANRAAREADEVRRAVRAAERSRPEFKARTAERDATAERKAYRKWYKTTPEYAASRRKTQNKRYLNDPNWRLQKIVGAHIRFHISKSGRPTREYLDYSFETLRTHLENLWLPCMTWENHGPAWQIDHIIPQSFFDLTVPEQFSMCWALDNLRPLWAHLNRLKSDNIHFELPPDWQEVPAYV